MNAYSELYIDDASCNLGEYLDHMTSDLGYDIDDAFNMFAYSDTGYSFAHGNPRFITGMSGIELARFVLHELTGEWKDTQYKYKLDRSREYWTGWSLAQYQWEKDVLFSDMVEYGLTASTAENMYILHEADISKFIMEADIIIENGKNHEKSKLRRLRRYAGLTQRELSEKAGVSLRMIQLYEQGQSDISHAQINIVKPLADALDCRIEELI